MTHCSSLEVILTSVASQDDAIYKYSLIAATVSLRQLRCERSRVYERMMPCRILARPRSEQMRYEVSLDFEAQSDEDMISTNVTWVACSGLFPCLAKMALTQRSFSRSEMSVARPSGHTVTVIRNCKAYACSLHMSLILRPVLIQICHAHH